jgi:single-stranded DNA-binding protein
MVSGLVRRTFETENGGRRTAIEIQVQHLAADVQFAAVEINKAEAGDSPAQAAAAG